MADSTWIPHCFEGLVYTFGLSKLLSEFVFLASKHLKFLLVSNFFSAFATTCLFFKQISEFRPTC